MTTSIMTPSQLATEVLQVQYSSQQIGQRHTSWHQGKNRLPLLETTGYDEHATWIVSLRTARASYEAICLDNLLLQHTLSA